MLNLFITFFRIYVILLIITYYNKEIIDYINFINNNIDRTDIFEIGIYFIIIIKISFMILDIK
jgi:hypothetical protein